MPTQNAHLDVLFHMTLMSPEPAQSQGVFVQANYMSVAASESSENSQLKARKLSPPNRERQHNFSHVTFTKPTYCDICNSFIWGVVKQGHSCSDCGLNCHRKCLSLITSICFPPSPNLSPSFRPSRPSPPQSGSSQEDRDMVTELFAETQLQSRKLQNFYQESNPSFSALKFMKNNQRYTDRQLPFIWIKDTALHRFQILASCLGFFVGFILD